MKVCYGCESEIASSFLTGRYNNSSLSVDPGGGSISGMFVSYVRIIQNFVCLSVGYLYISLLKVG